MIHPVGFLRRQQFRPKDHMVKFALSLIATKLKQAFDFGFLSDLANLSEF